MILNFLRLRIRRLRTLLNDVLTFRALVFRRRAEREAEAEARRMDLGPILRSVNESTFEGCFGC